jgi:hypothetical protein
VFEEKHNLALALKSEPSNEPGASKLCGAEDYDIGHRHHVPTFGYDQGQGFALGSMERFLGKKALG